MIRRIEVFNGQGALMSRYTVGSPEPQPLPLPVADWGNINDPEAEKRRRVLRMWSLAMSTRAAKTNDAALERLMTGNIAFDFEWTAMLAAVRSPNDRKKLTQLRDWMTALSQRIAHIPSPELQRVVGAYLHRAFDSARQGDFAAAQALLGTAERFLNEADKVLLRLRKQSEALTGNGLPGPAGRLLAQMGQWLQAAIGGAQSLDDLNAIESLGARALEISRRFHGLEPGSLAYRRLMRDFGPVVSDLLDRVPDAGLRGQLRTGFELSMQAMQGVADLGARLPAGGDRKRLAQLEQVLLQGIETGAQGPEFQSAMKRILDLAGQNQLDQALQEAGSLVSRMDQMTRLKRHLDSQVQRLGDRVLAEASPEQAKAFKAFLADLAKKRDTASSPDELLAIDRSLVSANSMLAQWQDAKDPVAKQLAWQAWQRAQPVQQPTLDWQQDSLQLSAASSNASLVSQRPALRGDGHRMPDKLALHERDADAQAHDLVSGKLARLNAIALKQTLVDPAQVLSFSHQAEQQRQRAADAVDLALLAHRIDTIVRGLQASGDTDTTAPSMQTVHELLQGPVSE